MRQPLQQAVELEGGSAGEGRPSVVVVVLDITCHPEDLGLSSIAPNLVHTPPHTPRGSDKAYYPHDEGFWGAGQPSQRDARE